MAYLFDHQKKLSQEKAHAMAVNKRFHMIERPGAPDWQEHSHFREGDKESVKRVIGNESFNDFAIDAYASKDGYAIRINPLTGEKEMFVAGTHGPTELRGLGQWGLNLWDTGIAILEHPSDVLGPEFQWTTDTLTWLRGKGLDPVPWLDPWRQRTQKRLAKIAKEQGVDTIYGHSRGGALVADMDVNDGVKKVGLDAAMLLASDRDMQNFREDQLFDYIIGLGGQRNETGVNEGPKFHSVWN